MINRYWGKYPFIFTTDAHYLKAEERNVHKAFLNSKSSSDREVDDFYKYAYVMSQDEIRSLMPYLSDDRFNEMVTNTKHIQSMCSFYELDKPKTLAKVQYEHYNDYADDLDIFNDVDEETYPNFYYYLHSENQADQYLARLVAHGFVEKMKSDWDDDVYFSRLEEEFWTIKQVGDAIDKPMSDYFITMSKMVDLMWEAGSLVGPSRGSAGALLINYLIDITQINPIELDLPFVWRFMHPSRPDYPDIDVDSESSKRQKVFNTVRDYFRSIGGDIVNVCTFGTEGTKSALKTAGRGLDIDLDVINYITSMIPNERGFDWSLHDCYYGNDDDRKPIKAFVAQMDQYPVLWELAQTIEGLVTRLGVHASGVVCVNGDYTEYGSFMKTNNEQLVTCYDLHDQERISLIKYDMLTVSALDRIHQCLNYMLEDGTLQWQGSLKETYNKYLDPSKLDYSSPEMWRMAADGEIRSLFQFDTAVGGQSIKKIKPTSLKQLAIANSIMRLMSDGEQPIDIYVKQKMVPEIWYDDMRANGLTKEEIKILEKYLGEKDGVADSQEVVMQLSMDKGISGFDMKDANKLRKVIAKKKFSEIESLHDYYMDCGRKLGNSDNILNYVWDKQFKLSFGYSFSTIHTTGYSVIAIQEMNLAYHYPIIYWNTACLSVDSSAINDADFENLIDEGVIDYDYDDDKKVANSMDYGKMAAALDLFKRDCKIELPDINRSKLAFIPDVENNSILYGLKGICKVTDPTIEEIMMNRPFSSLQDFLSRVIKKTVTKDKVINLIKCGAFDKIEHKDREEVMKDFIWTTCEPKKRLTLQNANMLIDLDLLPSECEYASNVYKLTKELRRHRDAQKLWYCIDSLEMPEDKIDAWKGIFKDSKIDYSNLTIDGEDRVVISSEAWDRFYERNMETLRAFIKNHHDELLKKLNDTLFENEFKKYCPGSVADWELDSLNFYFHEHPLAKVIPEIESRVPELNIDRVGDVVEGAADGEFYIKGKIIPKMKLYTLAGTVIDRDKTKGTVSIQCPSGVVTIKVYKDLYAAMVAVIDDEKGHQDSYFEKGVHLLVTGIQRGSTFVPKVYKNTGRQAIERIVLDEEEHFKYLEVKR